MAELKAFRALAARAKLIVESGEELTEGFLRELMALAEDAEAPAESVNAELLAALWEAVEWCATCRSVPHEAPCERCERLRSVAARAEVAPAREATPHRLTDAEMAKCVAPWMDLAKRLKDEREEGRREGARELAATRARADRFYEDGMIAHVWFAKHFGEQMNGRDFAVKCPMADEALKAAPRESLGAK